MYSCAAFPLANLLSDLPFSAVRIFTYNITVYFTSGLHRSAGAFWTSHLISYLRYLATQGFFRTFGLCFQNFDTAFRMSIVFVPNIIQYSGYLIPEFSRISLVCDGAHVVPRNGPGMDKYPNVVGPNQTYTLYGAQPGSSTISGADYVEAGYTLDVDDL